MPLYEYVCEDCRHEFEELRPMDRADGDAPCPDCGSRRTRRKLSLCNAQSGGKSVPGTNSSSCSSCSGGTCSTCGH
ncbi:MAG: FmdB family zinc ribbon protein [Anaerolineales bacterium]